MMLKLIYLVLSLFNDDKSKKPSNPDERRIVFTDSVASWSREDPIISRFSFNQLYKEIEI
jgi:hypothetical protein